MTQPPARTASASAATVAAAATIFPSASSPPRRRFAPVPIETTFETYRKGVPAAVPTPSPSPPLRSPHRLWAHDKEYRKRRFAPQLIESSRRSRRVGDIGPATKPTDKTDITPYHNHIYAPKTRKKYQKHRRVLSLARRESCDDETADHFFETLVKENEKRILEDALLAFPNSQPRAGGAEHFAIREGSDDDSSGSGGAIVLGHGPGRRPRRDSTAEDVGWALREMQEHHELLLAGASEAGASDAGARKASTRKASAEEADGVGKTAQTTSGTPGTPSRHMDRISTLELDNMEMESPPNDPIWTTMARPTHHDEHMPYIPETGFDFPSAADGYRGIPAYARRLREAEGETEDDLFRDDAATPGPIGETCMPLVPTTSSVPSVAPKAAPATPAPSNIPPDTGFRGRGPFAGYRNRDLFAERDVHRLRRVSPPMLGKNLIFPLCGSPQQTQLKPEYLWSMSNSKKETHRDATGKHGLWNGYCYSKEQNEALAPIERPILLATPFPPSSPSDPFAHAFAASDPGSVCSEPESIDSVHSTHSTPGAGTDSFAAAVHALPIGALSTSSTMMALRFGQHRAQKGLSRAGVAELNGLHALMGLDARLQAEKEAAERETTIAAEFDDRFVTQVYNYLSLGYPVNARPYDEELAKITRVPMDTLRRDDIKDTAGGGTGGARGHLSLDGTASHDDCPRWHALRLYIYEWARQHPDLEGANSLAWGVRERRGSWGV